MKSSMQPVLGHRRPALHSALAVVLFSAATLAQAKVIPPPLPPGSAMVQIEPGMDKEERKRATRAHHHKGDYKKDMTRDDSDDKENGKGDDKGTGKGNENGSKK